MENQENDQNKDNLAVKDIITLDQSELKKIIKAEATKATIVQIIAIIIAPISIAVTVFLTEKYKAPDPEIQFVNCDKWVYTIMPNNDIRSKINTNEILAPLIREFLEINSNYSSLYWLNARQEWRDENTATFENLIFNVNAKLDQMLEEKYQELKMVKTLKDRIPTSDFDIIDINRKISNYNSAKHVIEDFKNELKRIDTLKKTTSGEVMFSVGILNKGANDGVVFNEAKLYFNNKEFSFYSDNFYTIKAHSFEKVNFITQYVNNGKITSSHKKENEKTIQEFSDLIKSGKSIPYKIKINLSSHYATYEDTIR